MYLLGYDIGSSTIKAALLDAESHAIIELLQYPEREMAIISRQRAWAEQQPEIWWQDFCTLTQQLIEKTGINPEDIKGIGISYQMHGLVLIDQSQQILRPAIIWCDSRAVTIGQQAFQEMGEKHCLTNFLNSPGNFTASKLKWIKDNEPEIYDKTHKFLLPGDFIAMKLTGEATTTISGLTEGIFWDFKNKDIAHELIEHYGFRTDIIADRVPTFSIQGKVNKKAAAQTGLALHTPITYRAGDQPNNALALNVLRPGEVAATSGTSGVVYGIVDQAIYDKKSRVNSFAHVNYEENFDRIGVLLCLNGAGIEYTWMETQIARKDHNFNDMERMASTVPVGSDGLSLLPFGNGAERILENKNINSHIFNLDYNRHTRAHLYRASLEGVAFSFVYGINILKSLGLEVDTIRVANDNMFQSKIFSTTIAALLGSQIEVVDTTGAIGAARAAGVAAGVYSSLEEALQEVKAHTIYEPSLNFSDCEQAYNYWQSRLHLIMEERSSDRQQKKPINSKKIATLEKEIQENQKVLASTNLKMNDLLDLLEEVSTALQKDTNNSKTLKNKLLKKIAAAVDQTNSWEDFATQFNILHDDFFKKLNHQYPELSIQELKMCAYIKMKYSTKEIADRLHISIRGAETCRYRLRKKFELKKGQSLHSFLEQQL